MRLRSLVAPSIAIVGVVSLAALAVQPEQRPGRQPGQPGQQPGVPGQPERGPGRGPGAGAPPSVEGGMKGMNRASRTLKEQIGDPSKQAENLTLINDMQRGCINAKGASMDEFLKDLPAGERAAKAKDYREEMIELARLMLDLEEATLAGDTGKASEIFAKIGEMREHEHEEFGVEEDEDEGFEPPPPGGPSPRDPRNPR